MEKKIIYTRIVFDITQPEFIVLESEFEEYSGPLALCDDKDEDQSVLKQVEREIKAFGENTRKSFEEINTLTKELRGDLDNLKKEEPIVKEKIDKLTTAITKHQENLDQQNREINSRIDSIEVSLKRSPMVGSAEFNNADELKTAIDFYLSREANRGEGMNALLYQVEKEDAFVQQAAQEYKDYVKYFGSWLRRGENYPGIQTASPILNPDQIKLLHVGSDPDGGIFVTPEMSARIIDYVRQVDPMRSLATIETISTDRLEIQEDLDEAGAAWAGKDNNAGERVAGPVTGTPKMKKVVIPVHIMEARPHVTQILLDDAGINVETWLANKVSRRFGRLEAAAFVNGDGVNQPRGILDYDNGTAFDQVEQVALGGADFITTNGLLDLQFSLLEEYLSNAQWLMNRLTLRDIMKLKDGDGQYIWRPGLEMGRPSILLGFPTNMGTTMPVIAANALSICFADFREFYTIVERQGIIVQRDPYTVKPLIEFFTRSRVGGGVVNFQAGKIGKVSV